MIYFQIILFILFFINNPTAAKTSSETEWLPITPKDWQLEEDCTDGHDAVLLLEKIIADDRRLPENKCYLTLYRKIKISSKEARKWANVKAPLIHEQQKIRSIKGRTTLQSGEKFYLLRSQILEKNIYKTHNVEIDQLSFAMPGVSDNSIIEYTIEYEIPQPNHRWLFQKELPLIYGEYRWVTYQFQLKDYFDYNNHFDLFSSDVGQKTSNSKNDRKSRQAVKKPGFKKLTPDFVWLQDDQDIHTEFIPSEKEPKQIVFSVKNVPAFEVEPLSLPEISLKHQLRCYYLDGDPNIYWKSIAKNTVDFFNGYSKLSDKLREVTAKYKLLNSDYEKITACYNWLQQNLQTVDKTPARYNSKSERTINGILQRGFGTVAEINYLFYFMLKDLGIDAYMAYASNRTKNLFYPDVKQLEFDINLVAVPNWDIDYRFYSPGEKFLPETQVPWYAEGAMAFLVNDRNYGFQNIPFSSPNLNKNKRITWLKVDKQLNCEAQIFEVYKGHGARKYQYIPDNPSISYWEESLLNEFVNIVPEFIINTSYAKPTKSKKAQKSFIAKVQFPLSQNLIPPRLFIRPADFMMKVENPFHLQNRTQSIVFDYAYELVDVLHMELPKGWALEALPKPFEFENDIGLCETNFFTTGKMLSAQRKFRLNKPVWQASDYEEVCNLFNNQQMSTLLTTIIKVEENATLSLVE